VNTIQQDVAAIVAAITKAPVQSIRPETDLRADLNVDSLQGLQIVAAIEQHFDVTIPDDELDVYTNMQAIVDAVSRLRGAA
jgi:acyl carrier protein